MHLRLHRRLAKAMLRVYSGEDRVAAEKAVKSVLGGKYEVFEGEDLTANDLPSIFLGTSLFATEKRQILLKNLSENAEAWGKLPDYLETEHDVVVWEPKIDKRSVVYKALKSSGVEMREFASKKPPEMNVVFGIFDLAMRDGKKAVSEVEKIELTQDPYMFMGLMVTQALKKFEASRGGVKEKRVLKLLAELDMQMKSSSVEPWMLVKATLVRLSEM